jgi:hypothetical protein
MVPLLSLLDAAMGILSTDAFVRRRCLYVSNGFGIAGSQTDTWLAIGSVMTS